MPRLTPETAEMMKATVSTVMVPMMKPLPRCPTPLTISVPRAICSEPMPSEMAVPNSVTMMAKMSMNAPSGPRVPSTPSRGSKMAEISGGRPRR